MFSLILCLIHLQVSNWKIYTTVFNNHFKLPFYILKVLFIMIITTSVCVYRALSVWSRNAQTFHCGDIHVVFTGSCFPASCFGCCVFIVYTPSADYSNYPACFTLTRLWHETFTSGKKDFIMLHIYSLLFFDVNQCF